MATFKLTLDKRRARKDETFPIVFKVNYCRKQTIISTGIYVKEGAFCENLGLIPNEPQLNSKLLKLDSTYRNRFYDFILNRSDVKDINALKNHLLNKSVEEITVFEYWQQIIREIVTQKRLGNAKTYEQSLSTISQEINLNIPFKAFSYKNLVELEGNLINRGMTANGISVYLRSFRAVCNRAIKEDIVGYDWYPFRKFTIRKAKTTPRVVGIEDMRRYFNLDYPPTHPRFIYWHIGKLLFLLRGINLRDLLQLKPSDIKNGRIIYRRSKTGKIYSIELTEEMKASFAVFQSDHTLLGMMREDELLSSRRILIYKQRVKITNKHLKNIGNELGIEEPLSTYVFRYTYANIAKQLGYSKDLIAEALGHEYGNKITGIYLEQFDLMLIDEMNSRIIKATVLN
jgi:integrase/recombinase XerD